MVADRALSQGHSLPQAPARVSRGGLPVTQMPSEDNEWKCDESTLATTPEQLAKQVTAYRPHCQKRHESRTYLNVNAGQILC